MGSLARQWYRILPISTTRHVAMLIHSFVYVLCLSVLGGTQKTVPDGLRGTGTDFVKCGGGFFGGSKKCFEVRLSKLLVQMGSDGTNDDVTVKICSDGDKVCCTTPPLKKTFSDDWSKNDLEDWSGRYLGECRDKKFLVEKELNVSLVKQGKDTLEVTSLVIEAKNNEKFECGVFYIGGGVGGKTNVCRTTGYSYEVVKAVTVTMGNEGTNDDVRVEICSDLDTVCCRTKLSSVLSDDWSRNDEEVWRGSDLRKCKDVRYKVGSGVQLTLVKDGTDDLVVNKLKVETEDLNGNVAEYDCKHFTLRSAGKGCEAGDRCTQTNLCPKPRSSSIHGATTRTRTATPVLTITRTPKPGTGLLAQAGLVLGAKKTTTTTTTTTQRTTSRTTRKPFFG